MTPAKYMLTLRMTDRHGALQQLTGLLYRRRYRFEALYSAAIPHTNCIMVHIILADERAGRIAAELETLYDVLEVRRDDLNTEAQSPEDDILRRIRLSAVSKSTL